MTLQFIKTKDRSMTREQWRTTDSYRRRCNRVLRGMMEKQKDQFVRAMNDFTTYGSCLVRFDV